MAICAFGISLLPAHLKLSAITFVALATSIMVFGSIAYGSNRPSRVTIERFEGATILRVADERSGRVLIKMPIRSNTPVVVRACGKIVIVGDVDPFVYCAYAAWPNIALRSFDYGAVLRGLERPLEFAECLEAMKLQNTH